MADIKDPTDRDPFQEIMISDDIEGHFRRQTDVIEILQDPDRFEEPTTIVMAGFMINTEDLFGDNEIRVVEIWQESGESLVVIRNLSSGCARHCYSVLRDEVKVLSDSGRPASGDEVEQLRMFMDNTDWCRGATALAIAQVSEPS